MNLFDLSAVLRLDANDFYKQVDRSEGAGNKLANALHGAFSKVKNIGILAAGGLSATAGAIVPVVKSAVNAYKNFQQLEGGVETLFKHSAEHVKQNAANAYKTAGMSANQYMETVTSFSASLISSLGGDTRKAADIADMAIVDMSDNANKMGTDIASIQMAYQGFAKQNYTMLDNLKLGYGGTKTEMERLLSDAEKLTGKKYDIDNLADVYEAIHEIQNQWNITGTTALEANDTIEGSINQLKASWENMLVAISDPNGNIKEATQNLIKSGKIMLNNVLPAVKQSIKGFGQFAKEAAPIIGQYLPEIISDVLPDLLSAGVDLAAGLLEGLTKGLSKVKWSELKPGLTKLWQAAQSGLSTLGGLIFGKNADGSIKWPTWSDVKAAFSSAWETIKSGAASVMKLIFGETEDGGIKWPTWDEVSKAFGVAWELIKTGASALMKLVFGENEDGSIAWPTWEQVSSTFASAWEAIKTGASSLMKLIFGENADGSIAWPTWEQVQEGFKAAWEAIKTGASSLMKLVFGENEDGSIAWPSWEQISTAFNTWWTETFLPGAEAAMKWTLKLFGMPEESAETLTSAISGWWDSVKSAAEGVISWALGLPGTPPHDAGEQLREILAGWWDGVKSYVNGIFSFILGLPSAGDEDGTQTKEKIENWWKEKVKPLVDGALNFVLGLLGLPDLETTLQNIKDWWDGPEGVWTQVKDTIKAMMSFSLPSIDEIVKSINTWWDNVKSRISLGITAIWRGITGQGNEDLPEGGDGSSHGFAKGLWNVPYDNFAANLHRGEMVLTQTQARQYRDGNSDVDLASMMGQITDAIRNGMAGATVQSFLNGKDITRAVNREIGNQIKSRRFST